MYKSLSIYRKYHLLTLYEVGSKTRRFKKRVKLSFKIFFPILHNFVLNPTHLTKHNTRIDHSYICNKIGRLLETSNFVFHGILKVIHYNNLKRPIVHNATFEQREITLRIALHGIDMLFKTVGGRLVYERPCADN